jgi:MarR family transcriptional regulator, organic hydroperoxide resistance regulator
VRETDNWVDRFDAALRSVAQHLGANIVLQAPFDLTPGQVFLLHLIKTEEHCTVSQLAEKMEVKPSAITVMLDRLESRRYIERFRDQQDRRVVIVQLTETGLDVLQKIWNLRKRVVGYCLNQLDGEELTVFIQAFEKLARIAADLDVQQFISTINDEEKRRNSDGNHT